MKPKSRWPPGQTTPPTTLVQQVESYEFVPTVFERSSQRVKYHSSSWKFNKNVFTPGYGSYQIIGSYESTDAAYGDVVLSNVVVPLADVPDEDSVRAIGDMLLAMAIMKEGV